MPELPDRVQRALADARQKLDAAQARNPKRHRDPVVLPSAQCPHPSWTEHGDDWACTSCGTIEVPRPTGTQVEPEPHPERTQGATP